MSESIVFWLKDELLTVEVPLPGQNASHLKVVYREPQGSPVKHILIFIISVLYAAKVLAKK